MTRFLIYCATLLLLLVPVIWCQMTFAERKALEDFKVTVPALAFYWTNDTDPCTDWEGVTCTSGRVTKLDFRTFHTTGSLPDSLGDLSALKTLYTSANYFNGTIPASMGDLSELTDLETTSNSFSGGIPDSIGKLSKLTRMALQNNQFVGCLSLENNPSGNYAGNKLCCYDTRYAPIDYIYYTCEASSTLSITAGSVKSPQSTYYTSLSVEYNGVLDLTNQTELITAECLTINGTIRVNMSLVDSSTQLTDIDLIKFTCSSTNISSIAMDIIACNECQSSYQIREKIVGRTRTVNADITVECPDRPGVPLSSAQPSTSSSPMTDKPSSPSHSPQSTVVSVASSVQYMMYLMLYCFAVIM